MAKVDSVMLELTGKCVRRCPLCLPPELRTNRDLAMPEILALANQFCQNEIRRVTFCGYGSPVDHPDIHEILWLFGSRIKMQTAIVCRPEQLCKMAWLADDVFISIDGIWDVAVLEQQTPTFMPALFPTVMLTDRSVDDLPAIFKRLLAIQNVALVSVTHPMVLCGDPEHRRRVVETNQSLPANEDKLMAAIKTLPGEQSKRVRYFGSDHFAKACRFHGSISPMIYVDSNLRVRMCCHQPTSKPLGDLRTEKLKDILAGPVAKFHETWQEYESCRLCPDDGLAVEI